MKVGAVVRHRYSEGGLLGMFVGYEFSGDYKYARVLWPDGRGVCGIQPSLIELIHV